MFGALLSHIQRLMARHWDTTLPLCSCIDILLLNGRQSQVVNPGMSGMYMVDCVIWCPFVEIYTIAFRGS